MRIISGLYKGKKILLPTDKNTRPLKDLTKESIFNLIIHSKFSKIELEKSNVLDLFAGSGSFGLECISRGASEVIFCENYKPAIKISGTNKSIEPSFPAVRFSTSSLNEANNKNDANVVSEFTEYIDRNRDSSINDVI